MVPRNARVLSSKGRDGLQQHASQVEGHLVDVFGHLIGLATASSLIKLCLLVH
jgi:hypothetical protein